MSPRPRQTSDEAILMATMRVMQRRSPVDLTLADVAKEAGVVPATLIQRFGNAVAITWAPLSGQVLQSASHVTGPWRPVPGGTVPPYVIPINSTNQFYRILQQ